MKCRRILGLVIAAGLLPWVAVTPAAAQVNVLVDASRDGGVWWSPQAANFDPSLPHQGKTLADLLRGQGRTVTELPRPSTITCEQLSEYDLVVAMELGPYSPAELNAYMGYLSSGGRLILLSDHKTNIDSDSLPLALGLDFSGSLDGVMTTLTAHPITLGVSPLNYPVGSTVTTAPGSATMLGFVSGLPVMGVMPFGRGQVFFLGDTNLLEEIPQPLVNNLFGFMLDGAQPVNACSVAEGDFDRDDRADVAVYRSRTGEWFIRRSGDGGLTHVAWGAPTLQDAPVPADYDGDGQTDIAVYRRTTGEWFIHRSGDGGLTHLGWGAALADVPVPADYDGDGEVDIAVYRRTTGEWFIRRSRDAGLTHLDWGAPTLQDTPVPADYDGDGQADIAVYRQATGEWFIHRSGDGGLTHLGWGAPTLQDVPVPADYDGDGQVDIAVYRRTAGEWFIHRSGDGGLTHLGWGAALADVPVPADYDGDGRVDIAVYRSSTGEWFIRQSSDGGLTHFSWGAPTLGDVPPAVSGR